MCKFQVHASLIALLIAAGDAYRILGVFPSLDRSNYLVHGKLFRELASKGHEVTLIGNFPMVDAPATYKDIIIGGTPVYKGLSFESVITSDIIRIPFETLVSTKTGNDECRTVVGDRQVQQLVTSRSKFDVVVVESLNSDCGLALAHNLSAPYIALVPRALQPWQYSRLGIAFNPAYVAHPGLSSGKQPSFLERVKSYLLHRVTNWVYYVGSQVTDHVLLYSFLGDSLPSMESIAANTSLVLVNSHPSVFGGVTRPDNVVDIGGIHVRAPRVVPTEIERFINEAEHGVVYVSLGSTVKESTFPKQKLEELLLFFSKLPLRVLWRWDGESLDALPRNVMAKRWMPQHDILRHGDVKMFVSHCGLLSSTEAVAAGVPVACVPLFGDQFGNAAALRDSGLATVILYEDLDSASLMEAANELLDPRWQQRAKQLSRVFHDRPMSPLETAIYWIEYVARYGGAPHLAATSVGVPIYQQYQLDVLAFLSLVLFGLLYAVYKLMLAICCCGLCRSEDTLYVERRGSKRVKFE